MDSTAMREASSATSKISSVGNNASDALERSSGERREKILDHRWGGNVEYGGSCLEFMIGSL
eukprot:CAMPEP_0197270664 /NCGR_PEP_ID=MMETSP1432-20130617/7517_1 /TAXON_ID=44447 /ORGANISM="Pseudo-nitzschia delicatissima, Strain UNC1205" /LENGTH=61 /DNA_ID=CAMNT_0042735985 /DNA_START=338 /DNA_END=523 /DNA_ORIENTATION=+